MLNSSTLPMIDSLDDECRDVIAARWPGGKPDKRALEVVLGMVKECLSIRDDPPAADVTAANLLTLIEDAHDARLTAICLKIILNLEARSQTEIAKHLGVTRANVSRVCVELTERLNMRPGRGMRSTAARQRYRIRQKRAKPKPSAYGFKASSIYERAA